jgi:hypothetical protein
MKVLQQVLNNTVQYALLLSKLEVLKNTVNVTNVPFLWLLSITFFCCRYLTSKNVPIPPLVDQIFTHKIR